MKCRTIGKKKVKYQDRLKAKARRFSYKWSGITKERFQELIRAAIGVACFFCGTILTVENMSADHRNPKSKEGKDTEINLRLICKMCNTTKSDFSEECFLALLKTSREHGVEPLLRTKLRASNLVFGGRR